MWKRTLIFSVWLIKAEQSKATLSTFATWQLSGVKGSSQMKIWLPPLGLEEESSGGLG